MQDLKTRIKWTETAQTDACSDAVRLTPITRLPPFVFEILIMDIMLTFVWLLNFVMCVNPHIQYYVCTMLNRLEKILWFCFVLFQISMCTIEVEV